MVRRKEEDKFRKKMSTIKYVKLNKKNGRIS